MDKGKIVARGPVHKITDKSLRRERRKVGCSVWFLGFLVLVGLALAIYIATI